jgi:putative spermidine/putrescine transport system permease protein
MHLNRRTRIGFRIAAALGLSFIYVPLLAVLVNSFNTSKSFAWPPSHFTTHWWSKAFGEAGVRQALGTSVRAGLGATAVALVLGTMAAFALQRYEFFGRSTVSMLIVLPIALPGIVTGIAMNAAFRTVLPSFGIGLGLLSVVIAHATFCVVIVFNNVTARLRRLSASSEEASADLGARPVQTFALVTFPAIRSALFAGGLLAFALSFDEVVVTTFTAGAGVQTLPLWIAENLSRPEQAPVVDVVAAALVVLSVPLIFLAQRLSTETTTAQ